MSLLKRSEKGKVYVALHANDTLMAGDIEAIDEMIAALKEHGLV